MTRELQHELDASVWRIITSQDRIIQDMARQIAESAQPPWVDLGRRAQQRIPFPRLITMTPLRNDNLKPAAEPVHVVGKHLAPLGLDFFHHEPIPQRYVLVSLERANDSWVQFLMKITWCRFLKPGWYDSGGRFMKVVEWVGPSQDPVRSPPPQ